MWGGGGGVGDGEWDLEALPKGMVLPGDLSVAAVDATYMGRFKLK